MEVGRLVLLGLGVLGFQFGDFLEGGGCEDGKDGQEEDTERSSARMEGLLKQRKFLARGRKRLLRWGARGKKE